MLLDTAVGTIIRYRTILSYLCFDKQGASCARAPATRLRSRRAAIDQRATAVVPVFRLHHAVHLDGPVVVADHNCASVRAAIGRTLSPAPSMSGDPGRVPSTAPSARFDSSGATPREPRARRRRGAGSPAEDCRRCRPRRHPDGRPRGRRRQGIRARGGPGFRRAGVLASSMSTILYLKNYVRL